MTCVRGVVSGAVQMVGFRRFVQQQAARHGVSGFANNRADGCVEVVLCGTADAVRRVQDQVEVGPARAVVDRVEWREDAGQGIRAGEFTVGWMDPD